MRKMTTYKDFVGELTANYRRTTRPTVQITHSKVAADFIRPYFDYVMDDHEEAKVIHVNHENMIVNVHHVSSGTDTATLIPVKTIIRDAIFSNPLGRTRAKRFSIPFPEDSPLPCPIRSVTNPHGVITKVLHLSCHRLAKLLRKSISAMECME